MGDWKTQLQTAVDQKKRSDEHLTRQRLEAGTLLLSVVVPALREVQPLLEQNGRRVQIDVAENHLVATVTVETVREMELEYTITLVPLLDGIRAEVEATYWIDGTGVPYRGTLPHVAGADATILTTDDVIGDFADAYERALLQVRPS